MIEVAEYIKDDENAVELLKFIKKFEKIDFKKAKELEKKIEELNFMKIKQEQLSKIIDVMPETAEDLNKIFVDISLDENETQKILDTVKEFIK